MTSRHWGEHWPVWVEPNSGHTHSGFEDVFLLKVCPEMAQPMVGGKCSFITFAFAQTAFALGTLVCLGRRQQQYFKVW